MDTASGRALLIRPENIYNYNNYPPLGLISIGSKLKESGFEVVIINAFIEKDIYRTIKRYLEENPPLFIGISLLTAEIPDAYRIVKFIKENSNIPVIAGGWHCTLFPEQMAESGFFDYVIEGEGEGHIERLAGQLRDGHKPSFKIFPSRIIDDIENLPFPEYCLDDNIERFIGNYLTDKLVEYARQPMRWLPYQSSRGCPSRCTFCINTVTGNTRYRKKSAQKAASEIEAIVRRYKLSHLKIIDDNFFVDIGRVREICGQILKKGLDITWDAECRCDYFNERMLNNETLQLAKRAGLIQLTLGLESGSSHTLRLMKKGITLQQAEYAVRQCDRYKIIARSSFIIEIPGEEMPDIKATINFINRLRRHRYFTYGVCTFRPYPKCELTAHLVKNGCFKEPKNFAEWANAETAEMYTSAEYIRPWQANGRYSEAAAYYLNMESAVRLGNYQLDNPIDRLKNSLFILIAKIRNRLAFYRFSFDKKLYKNFLERFYKGRQDLERAGMRL